MIAVAALGACSATNTAKEGEDLDLTTASVASTATPAPALAKPLDEVKDDLTLGKEHFRATNYGLAELHFRRAVEATGDAEAWLGLGATYDQLKRFELADRAYARSSSGPAPPPSCSTTAAIPTCFAATSGAQARICPPRPPQPLTTSASATT